MMIGVTDRDTPLLKLMEDSTCTAIMSIRYPDPIESPAPRKYQNNHSAWDLPESHFLRKSPQVHLDLRPSRIPKGSEEIYQDLGLYRATEKGKEKSKAVRQETEGMEAEDDLPKVEATADVGKKRKRHEQTDDYLRFVKATMGEYKRL